MILRQLETANDLLRALLGAGAAAGTFLVIDLGNITVHVDGIELALLGAERTSDTAGLADIHDSLALVLVGALDADRSSSRNKFDQLARTGLDAGAAGGALALIDFRNTVDDVDRVELAGLHAGSVTETSELAGLVAGTGYRAHGVAVVESEIIISGRCLIAGAGTFDKSDLLLTLACRNAQDSRDRVPTGLLSYRTGIDRGIALVDRLGTAVAARISAAAAVVARKRFTDGRFPLINLNFELLAEQSQTDTDNDTGDRDNGSSDDNCSYTHFGSPP